MTPGNSPHHEGDEVKAPKEQWLSSLLEVQPPLRPNVSQFQVVGPHHKRNCSSLQPMAPLGQHLDRRRQSPGIVAGDAQARYWPVCNYLYLCKVHVYPLHWNDGTILSGCVIQPMINDGQVQRTILLFHKEEPHSGWRQGTMVTRSGVDKERICLWSEVPGRRLMAINHTASREEDIQLRTGWRLLKTIIHYRTNSLLLWHRNRNNRRWLHWQHCFSLNCKLQWEVRRVGPAAWWNHPELVTRSTWLWIQMIRLTRFLNRAWISSISKKHKWCDGLHFNV